MMRRRTIWTSCCLTLTASIAIAQPAGRSPVVQDVVIHEPLLWYSGPASDGEALPFPPLDQIPPIVMPEPRDGIDDPGAPGTVLAHDARTGQTFELPGAPLARPGAIPGFRGFDGGGWGDPGQRSFGCMTLVDDTAAYPFRINAKAAMRYVQNGQTHWRTCSAAMLDAEVALLAGHCVYNRTFMAYPEEIFIIPGWDGQGAHGPPDSVLNPYGWARGDYYIVATDWVIDGNFQFDMGAVILTRAAGMLTGWFGRAWDQPCIDTLNRDYSNRSFPDDVCYDGKLMYKWGGRFDSCPSGNLLQVNFDGDPPACCNTTHNGMSGSNAYYESGGALFAQAVNSHKEDTHARFVQMWTGFHDDLTDKINVVARGSALDIQPLDCNGPLSAQPGGALILKHLCTNPTNFDPAQQSYTFTWYLSANEHITAADTPLGTRTVQLNLSSLAVDPAAAMAAVQSFVTIPSNTPAGTYWLGVIYDPATDSSPDNNDATTWDAHQITIGS